MKKAITKEEVQKYVKARVRVDESTGCWVWTKGTDLNGYAHATETRAHKFCKTELVHRISYIVFKQDVPEDLQVRHRCNNPSCSNPDHLELGTKIQNIQDRKEAIETRIPAALHIMRTRIRSRIKKLQAQLEKIDREIGSRSKP